MLYHAYELNHAAMAPFREVAGFGKRLLDSPLNPFASTFAGKQLSAAFDLFETVTRRYGKPDWRLHQTSVNGFPVPVKDRVIWQKPFCQLIHFERDRSSLIAAHGKVVADPRVLVIAPLSGHYATLLRRTVESFLPDHEVYISDWSDARQVPLINGKFDLNDYIDYVTDMLHVVGPNAHIIGICQPGPPVLAAISLMSEVNDPDLPATMTFMGSPIDPRESPTLPNKLAMERSYEWFRDNVIYPVPWPNPGVMRPVYPGFLQLSGFISMNQDRHMSAHKDYFNHLVEGDCDSVQKHREFYDEYLAVLDLTAEFYLQTIRDVFQEFKLPKHELMHRGRLVKPEAVTKVALMTVEGENDDISGIGQTQAAHELCHKIPSTHKIDYIQPGVGHYGVFSGKRFRTEIQPRMREFYLSHFDRKAEEAFQNQNPHLISS